MSRNYIILIVIAAGLAIGILFMDKTDKSVETDPAALSVSWNDPSRFLTIEEVTKRIIMKDPGLLIIDLRPADQFKAFAIPGAVNIPFDSLLTASSLQILTMPHTDKVLYSNSGVWSDQAWLLCERKKIGSVFILEGGINEWFSKIVDLKEPSPSAPQEDIDNCTQIFFLCRRNAG
jgi:rhodanese-related sulfurtransferase